MTPEQHHKNIRKTACARGTDPFTALRAAETAAELLGETDGDKAAVIWPESAGGIAWDALEVPLPDNPDTVHAVFSPQGPADPALWKRIAGKLKSRSVRLELITLGGGPQTRLFSGGGSDAATPDHAPIGGGKRNPVVKILHRLLELLGSGETTGTYEPSAPAGTPKSGLQLADIGSIDPKARVFSAAASGESCLKESDPGDEFVLLGRRTPLDERMSGAQVLMAGGLIPVVLLAASDIPRAAGHINSLEAVPRPFVLMLDAPLNALAGFGGFTSLALLSPANTDDALSCLAWVKESGSTALVLDPGAAAHPTRAVFRRPWSDGDGVVVRESRKGGAGHILLVAPGKNISAVSRAADRLIRDNISITVVSQRFLKGANPCMPEDLCSDADVVLIYEESTYPGDLRSRVARYFAGNNQPNILLAPDGVAPDEIADLAARELRERRIRRTVDDVKADRWR